MFVDGEPLTHRCSVVGNFEEAGWNLQCPMASQWARQPVNNLCNYAVCNGYSDLSVQCYNRVNYVRPQQYHQQSVSYTQPVHDYQPNLYRQQIPKQNVVYTQPVPEFQEDIIPCYQQPEQNMIYPKPLPGQTNLLCNQIPDQQNVVYTQPVQTNLPCHQRPEWDYNTMCYNVDGQPCQYTNVVDLEDFMNNEKRKEKSRVAARCRRTKEMQIFSELTAALPARKEDVEQLDKASVMRLAISYLRVRDVVSMLPEDKEAPKLKSPKGLEEVQSELSYMNALDGFVLVLSQQGDIVYCSENIAEHLGVSQMEIMGQSVFEFSHPCDHEEIRESLRSSGEGRRDLLLRLKCTITSKGRNVHLKSASYKVIHVTGHMLTPTEEKTKDQDSTDSDEDKTDVKKCSNTGALVAVGRPIPHPANIETPLYSMTFITKHGLDMKFTDTDESLTQSLGFDSEELVGRSLYDYLHAADSATLVQQFKSLFSKGQCETGQYRFLAKTGGYAWVQTQATVITDKQQKPISVICVNYVISGIECKDEVFAAHQVPHADLKPAVAPTAPAPALPQICVSSEPPANGAIVGIVVPQDERPIPVTEQIFVPRKKEMNKGFLMFSQNEGLTMLKDEPEDLTHLAPTAGDACISLENNSPFDMFDDFMLNDNYCSLLGDDLANGSPVDSLIADSLLSSPEPQETESSCEQSSLLTELSLDAFDSNRSDDIDDGHSPFIPSTDDQLPLLEPAVMWGVLPDNVSQAKPQPSEVQSSAPALQRLLAAPPTGPPPQDIITNIYSDPGLIPSRSISSWDTGVKRVMKQEEEPTAKRVKRSPSPAVKPPTTQSSSVLMNLLDIHPQAKKQIHQQLRTPVTNYQVFGNSPRVSSQLPPQSPVNKNIPIPVINLIRSGPNEPLMRSNTPLPNGSIIRTRVCHSPSPMSPLSLNVGSPMYSLPSSPNTPNYSPAMSPVHKDRVLSPYSTPQSLSPAGSYHLYSPANKLLSPSGVMQGYDPYLNNKMQTSPGLALQSSADILLDSISLASSDYWPDSEILQGGTSDLLTAFDDVKLG